MADAAHEKKDAHDSHGGGAGHEHKKGGHKGGHGGGHGGGGHEEHEGAPEWLISFADMVMLMMGFFVIMFALNISPKNRQAMGGSSPEETHGAPGAASEALLDFTIGVREAFNNPVDLSSTDPADQPLIQRILQRAGKSKTVDPGIEGYDHDVQSIRPTDYYAISGSVMFAENSTDLPAGSAPTISAIADKVRGVTLVVEVRGHASATEAAAGEALSMRLASERALNVASELATLGVDWWQMRLVSCADHDRLNAFPGSGADDGANARVEVVITNEVVPDKTPTAPGSIQRPPASKG